jgi:hypothetical protein
MILASINRSIIDYIWTADWKNRLLKAALCSTQSLYLEVRGLKATRVGSSVCLQVMNSLEKSEILEAVLV